MTGYNVYPGLTVNDLTFIERQPNSSGKWLCRCSCGIVKGLFPASVMKGISKSCGCKRQSHRLFHVVDEICKRCGETFQKKKIAKKTFYCSKYCRATTAAEKSKYTRSRSVEATLRGVLACSKCRSKRKERPHNLTIDYLLRLLAEQNGKCALTGRILVPSNSKTKSESHPNTISIDRIDSDKGYVEGNVRLVTYIVNAAKNRFSDEELIQMCRDVIAYQREGTQEGRSL